MLNLKMNMRANVFLLGFCCLFIAAQASPIMSMVKCSYNYTLRPDESQCVRTSLDQYSTCTNFSDYLESFNVKIATSDCLSLTLEPGSYMLADHPAALNYSMIITSTGEQNVRLSCSQGNDTKPAIWFKGEVDVNRFVSVEGLIFEDCSRPLQFDDLGSVSFDNCSFSGFQASALDLFNINTITIHNSVFTNCSTNTGKERFRGNSGAVSIAYYSTENELLSVNRTTSPMPRVAITNCTFKENKAFLPLEQSEKQINQALNNNVYIGRGGAIGIFVQESSLRNVSALIQYSEFYGNFAESFGGGLYLLVAGSNTNHTFRIEDCVFTGNSADVGSFGGGMQAALLIRNKQQPPTILYIERSHFEKNNADYGGGLSTVQVYSQGAGNRVSVNDCTFVKNSAKNVGSALMFGSFLYVQNRFESYHYISHNNYFSENSCPGGTVGFGFISVQITGNNTFEFNNGPGLRVVGSLVDIFPNSGISFIGNDARNHEGGALFLQEFGQIKLYKHSFLEFVNNTGRIGSAIVVDVQRSSPVFSQLVFNPQCFLVYENSTRSPEDWEDVSITFSGNRASVGPALYISHLDHCSWLSASLTDNATSTVFTIKRIPSWSVFQFAEGTNEATSLRDAATNSSFYFETEPVSITSTDISNTTYIRPGEQGRLNLMGEDQFGNPAYVILRFSDERVSINRGAFTQAGTTLLEQENTTDDEYVRFKPALLPVQPNNQLSNIVYGIKSRNLDDFQANELVPILIDTPYNVKTSDDFHFLLSLVPCMPGFELRNSTVDGLVSCLCVRDEYYLLDCEDDVLILRDNWWGAEEREPLPHLDLTPCPATYCQCYYRNGSVCETLFFQTDPTLSLQCHPLRNGTLCGRCINGTGVGVLRTTCRDCGNSENYFVIGLLIVVDVVVVSLILLLTVKFHMIFPSSLKGFLFYVQTVYYTTEYFPISFWNVRRYMLFVSSAIGLYFPWDFCLFPTMSPLVSFSPKFTPAAIATLVSATAITIVYVTRSRDGREYIWHGVWTLILLLYAPLFHTCASLLHCRYTPNAQGSEESYHWYLDGEVECFQDPAHIALGLVAVFVLMVLVLLVPAVFLFTMCASSKMVQSKSRTVGWVYAALTAGYRESWEARMYSSFELVRRLLLIGMAVVLPGRSVSNLYVLLNVLAVHLFFKPYSKIWHNVLEACVLLLYTLLLSIRSTPTFVESISPYSGTGVPEDWNGDLTRTDSVTGLLFPFYYLPLVLAVVFIIGSIIYLVVKHFTGKKNVYKGVKKFSRKIKSIHISTENSTKRSSDYSDTVFGLDDLTTTLAQ